MARITRVVLATVMAFGVATAVGCTGASSATPAKPADKMGGDKMGGDKMGGDKMGGDKMTTGK